jgi:hypothetical protein
MGPPASLPHRYAARNLIEFYRMLEPQAATDRDVLAVLAAKYEASVFIDERGITLA